MDIVAQLVCKILPVTVLHASSKHINNRVKDVNRGYWLVRHVLQALNDSLSRPPIASNKCVWGSIHTQITMVINMHSI